MQALLESKEIQEEFLRILRITGSPTAASLAIGLNRSNATRYKNKPENEKFARKWNDAVEMYLDNLEMTLADRAINGVVEDVYFQGEVVGEVKKYSDSNGQFILKGRRSKIYRDKTDVNVTGLDTLVDRMARANARLAEARKPAALNEPDPEKFNIIEAEYEDIEPEEVSCQE